jgi:hypothetical protein
MDVKRNLGMVLLSDINGLEIVVVALRGIIDYGLKLPSQKENSVGKYLLLVYRFVKPCQRKNDVGLTFAHF